MDTTGLRPVLRSRRLNAGICWLLIAFLGAMAGAQAAVGETLWAGFVTTLAVLAVVPAVVYRSPWAMLPWEVLALASLPVLGRVLVVGETLFGVVLTGRVVTYLAVAAVALIVAVELDVFTPVRMNYSFAVLFVVVTTMATAGVWAVVQWLSDVYLGTAFVLTGDPESVVERALMLDFVAATVAGLLAGVIFELYFRRYADATARLPTAAVLTAEETDGGAVVGRAGGDEGGSEPTGGEGGPRASDADGGSEPSETAGDREEVRRT
jgi:hypothetical protein